MTLYEVRKVAGRTGNSIRGKTARNPKRLIPAIPHSEDSVGDSSCYNMRHSQLESVPRVPDQKSQVMYPARPSTNARSCARCGASLHDGAERCWLCGMSIGPAGAGSSTPAVGSKHVEQFGTYSLASLMMFVTLFSVLCGAYAIAPGIGLALTILLLPVFVRTALVLRRRRDVDLPIGWHERLVLAASSPGNHDRCLSRLGRRCVCILRRSVLWVFGHAGCSAPVL